MGKPMPAYSTRVVQQMLLVLLCLTATVQQATAQTASSAFVLSPGAAAGIAVAVSVTVCFAIGAVVICLLTRRRPRKPPPAGRSLSAIYDNEGRRQQNNTASGDQHHIINFVEEGSGAATESAALREHMQQNLRSSKSGVEVHAISVKVTSPDDLRFKICRRDGQILVATDPLHSSLCSREGVRTGDRILGVFVNLRDSPDAHPKEVCDLLTLSNDCSLVVDFEHHGPVQRSASEPSNGGHQRPVSAAEKALRKQRDPPVEVVDGGGGGGGSGSDCVDSQTPTPPERHYPAARSRKLHAPPPPEEGEGGDGSGEFAIGVRRVRIQVEGEDDEEGDGGEVDGQLQKFCETLAEVGDEERNGSGDDESLLEAEFKPKQQASSAASGFPRIIVERIFDYYELEEQDVVTSMAPPSDQRPVVDCSTQFDGDLGRGSSLTGDVEEAAALIAAPVWISLPNHPEQPYSEPLDAIVEEQPTSRSHIALRRPSGPGKEDLVVAEKRQAILQLSLFADDAVPGKTEAEEIGVQEERTEEPEAVRDRTEESKVEEDRTEELEVEDEDEGAVAGRQFLIVEAEHEPFQLEEHFVLNRSSELDDTLAASLLSEAALNLESDCGEAEGEDDDEEHELTTYLQGQQHLEHQQQPHLEAPASTAPSSVLTVQEEAVVEVLVPKANALMGVESQAYRPDNSLEELARNIALRDIEVATVILLDSEAQQDGDGGDTTEPSSGRSTVHEESIQPREAPDRRAETIGDQTLDQLWDFDPDADPDVELADALNEDFEQAAAEWAAKNAPLPPPPHLQLPSPLQTLGEVEEEFDGNEDDLGLSPERKSPLLDEDLVNEIVDGTRDIWRAEDKALDEAASVEGGDFGLEDSDLTGERLDRLLARLEDKDEGMVSHL